MTCLYLVRHGATDEIGRSFTGRLSGISLNTEGREQAASLAEKFRDLAVRAIYSSPSDRARQTADVIAAAAKVPVQQNCAFHEIEIGDWSGATFETLNEQEDFRLFNSVRSLARPPAGELMLEVQSRAVAELLRVSQICGPCPVVVVTHSDVIKAVLAYFLGIPLDLAHRLVIDLASVSVIELASGTVRVVRVNS
jgi:broad specificity phosphatase PhoE